MISSQPQRRRLYVILDELEKDILPKDDVVPSDLERVKEHLDRILQVIHLRCEQQLEATIARPTEPGSVGAIEPTKETLPTSRYEVETRRTARRDSGVARRPSELGSGRDKEPLAEPQSKVAWVDTVADSLHQKRDQIENHAKLPLDEQMKFDWTQEDARITHCLAGIPKGSEGHLRSLAARSLALQFEEWSCTGMISEQISGKVAKNGDIPTFVNTLKVNQDDKKQVTTVISAGRKMLLLERAFGCSAISAVVAFVWRSFYRARNEDIVQLGSKLRNCWLSQYAKEHQSRFDEGFHLYEDRRLRRKRQLCCSSCHESAARKRARPNDVSGVWAEGNQAALSNPTSMQSSQTADHLGNVANFQSSSGKQQSSIHTANATISTLSQGYADERNANNYQLGILPNEIEASIMPAPAPQWQYSSAVEVPTLPTLNDMQWNNLTGEIEASIMSAPDPRWQCTTTVAVPALGNDGQWNTNGIVGNETLSNDEWNLLSDELELSTMPGPGIWPEVSGLAVATTESS